MNRIEGGLLGDTRGASIVFAAAGGVAKTLKARGVSARPGARLGAG